MLVLKIQKSLPYLIVFTISTGLFCWFAWLSDTTIGQSALAFHRDVAMGSQWWQLISAHFMHNNLAHYVVNMAGLGVLYLLHGEYARVKSFSVNIVVLGVGISVSIYYFSPTLVWYVGLSGILHGLFAWGVIIDLYYKRRTGYLLLFGLFIKLMHEQLSQPSTAMADMIGVRVAIDAHLYGAIIGIMLGILTVLVMCQSLRRKKSKPTQ